MFLFSDLKTEKKKKGKHLSKKKKRRTGRSRAAHLSQPKFGPTPSRTRPPSSPSFSFPSVTDRWTPVTQAVTSSCSTSSAVSESNSGSIRAIYAGFVTLDRVHINPTSSASFCPQNPSFYAAGLLGIDLVAPPLPPVRTQLRPLLRRPQHLFFPLFALFRRCASPGQHRLIFPSPDRRDRARPTSSASCSNSGEQSPEEETTPEHAAAPSTSPRHADHLGMPRSSWSAMDHRERACRPAAAARRRSTEP